MPLLCSLTKPLNGLSILPKGEHGAEVELSVSISLVGLRTKLSNLLGLYFALFCGSLNRQLNGNCEANEGNKLLHAPQWFLENSRGKP